MVSLTFGAKNAKNYNLLHKYPPTKFKQVGEDNFQYVSPGNPSDNLMEFWFVS